MAHTVYIRGIPENPSITEVNVRTAPGADLAFKAPLNATAEATEVQVDPQSNNYNGQVYRWFHLKFPDSRSGWVRDDLIDLQGDCTPLGYGTYENRIMAFAAYAQMQTPAPVVTVNIAPAEAAPQVVVQVAAPAPQP